MDNELLSAISSLMDEKLQPIKDDISELKTDISGLKTDVSSLKAGQAKLENDIDFISGQVVIMENVHGNKLDALFDGYSLLNEKLDDHTVRLDRIEEKVDRLESTVSIHEIKINKIAK